MAAGVVVETGLMEAAARELNRGFFSRIERGRPWVRVKLAMSLDGRTALASGESKWISSDAARADVQRWRARSGAILTGSDTVLADDPQLTVRVPDGTDVVAPLARRARYPRAGVDDGAGVRRVGADPGGECGGYRARTTATRSRRSRCRGSKAGWTWWRCSPSWRQRGINELQVEAGATLCGALLAAGLVDELLLYVAPVLLGERGRPLFGGLDIATMAERRALRVVETRQVGPDIRLLLRSR